MNLLTIITLAAVALNSAGLLTLLFEVAIICVVVWAILAMVARSGVVIPPVVRILLIAVASIVAIVLIARFLGVLV